ncbi:sterol desaturase family protein [Pseudohaliea rubra]|uniref:Fatty acid hydroxylase-like protein n=1 Tax=Pseudohaliea rubra DSM 19751 TaxID=1265313 RepID=A0A095VRG1_9GAMM|nr:sterol desaturase family protein [Pseudohaliea rubra]KGE03965.1 Fatty acid hydroxylase-like protein [Pseudohaliea rubra DSM 19751]
MANTRHESIRLFENDLLERLSHVHPLTPLVFWGPIATWLLWSGLHSDALSPGVVAMLALAGIATWSLTEYLLHRYLFHFPAKSRFGKWLVFLFHGNHHDDPKDKTRLVMPPAGAIPIMAVLYLLFRAVLPAPWLAVFTAFFIVGYLVYDYIHYATHHFPMRNPVAKHLKHYHLKHHFSGQGGRYGVSSPLWDIVFGTRPAEPPRAGR